VKFPGLTTLAPNLFATRRKIMERAKSIFIPAAAMLMLLPACSSHNRALEQARTDFLRARQNPEIASHAPVALHEAGQSLRRAEQTWEETGDEREVEHLAYVAEQRTRIARQTAEQRIAEIEAAQLAEEREKVLLDARRREAEQARRQAEKSALAAQQARQGEQAQARAAEMARQEAEKRAQEAEIARQQAAKRAEQLELARRKAEDSAREAEKAREKARASAQRMKELEKELAAFKARETERGLQLTLSGVLFEFDKAELKSGALRGLSPLVAFLKQHPERQITLEGHTDSVGDESYNMELSRERAQAVGDFLVRNGVDADNISARGLGESYPVAANSTEAGRLQNRRVEIIISNEAVRTAEKSGR
jgi:outer membrane protein OmpA-like peptidoglycan-associated protein